MPRVTRSRELPSERNARVTMAHDLAERALEVADEPVRLVNGKVKADAVQAKRLQVELCKWLASQLYPEVYGDW